ncbi:hypothetical protein HanXRQr2_Chr08g0349411 [Helianthus annuus]|uniref:Transmembrane protein n=1 Tax=Helianthus annuus TaxID=4232 RepID=A0A251UAH9_HELAN|nr:hypothetical protein HanXRQr2_Chr08g0349411 [Helianthus annuus]
MVVVVWSGEDEVGRVGGWVVGLDIICFFVFFFCRFSIDLHLGINFVLQQLRLNIICFH